MPVAQADLATRTSLVRARFPRLAAIADREAGRRTQWGTTGLGPAENVIRTAVTESQLWIHETRPDLVGWYASWESYVELACQRIKSLKGAAR